jgi:predicted GNAT family acetyltransferase
MSTRVGTYVAKRFHDPAAFIARAEPWLLRAEAEHNLIIGIARQLAAGTMLTGKPVYLATVERDDDIVGCAFRTPPYKLGVTRMPTEAIDALVADVAQVYDELNAVMGDEETARVFAEAWARERGLGVARGVQHRIYQLDAVIEPAHEVPGAARLARMMDVPLVTQWIYEFSIEARVHTDNAAALATARIKQSSLYLWIVDGAPVSMAAWSGETPHGRRVGYVYTPAHQRGRGYASALVAHLSTQILADGCTFCFLYTDLSNPTSNSIYQRIGYRAVCDVNDWNFTPAAEAS